VTSFRVLLSCSCTVIPALFPTVEALPEAVLRRNLLNLFHVFKIFPIKMILHGREEEEVPTERDLVGKRAVP
jgi:hypothetical protein